MHYPHHYYGAYYRHGPRRLWWFFLGGAAVTMFHHFSQKKEREGLFWRRDCRRVKDGNDPAQFNIASNEVGYAYSGEDTKTRRENDEQKPSWKPLWKLRSEKEQERRQHQQEVEYREDLLKAREAVCILD